MFGTNNIGKGETVAQVFEKFNVLLDFLKENFGGNIFISGILPRPCDHSTTGTLVDLLNHLLRRDAEKLNYIYLPTWKPFTRQGNPRLDHFQVRYPSGRVDGIHPNITGIHKLRQYFKQMMGHYLGKNWAMDCEATANTWVKKPFH